MKIKSFYPYFLKISFLICLSFSLQACQVASPIITGEEFLRNLSQNQYSQASDLLVIQDKENGQLRPLNEKEKEDWIKAAKNSLGQINHYSLKNNVAIRESELITYGASQGYEVFYSLDSEEQGSQNNEIILFRINNRWKILLPSF